MSDLENSEEEEIYPPWNFSWVVENELAVMAFPQKEANLKYLVKQGIRQLITLSPEKLPPYNNNLGLKWTVIPVKEFEPPAIKDIIKFIDICQRSYITKQAVGVHCRMGRGRSGVMAACYLIYFQQLAPERAIINIRLLRPGSVETPEQERTVIRYHNCLIGLEPSEIQDVVDETEQYAIKQ